VRDRETGEGPELGRVEVWEPGERLLFTWRQPNWRPDEVTRVEVRFEHEADGTRVTLRHFGFDAVTSEIGCDVGYAAGWRELLAGYAGFVPTASFERILKASAFAAPVTERPEQSRAGFVRDRLAAESAGDPNRLAHLVDVRAAALAAVDMLVEPPPLVVG
jgi:hypothetical protein